VWPSERPLWHRAGGATRAQDGGRGPRLEHRTDSVLPPFVLVELAGKTKDADELGRWIWRGNQDQPGAPTIWRADGPASPESDRFTYQSLGSTGVAVTVP
jgi:hypothetical protein